MRRRIGGTALGIAALLLGCHGVDATGRSGMAGRLVDASGQPIAGQRILSLEAEGVTGPDGTFSVAWKDPETAIFFDRDGVHWQRAYRPEDKGTVVQVALPETETVTVSCGDAQCALELRWAKPNGLRARVRHACEPRGTFEAPLLSGEAEVRCAKEDSQRQWRLVRDGTAAQVLPR